MKTAAYWCVAVAILMVGLAMARSWENPSITALEWVVMRWVRIVGLDHGGDPAGRRRDSVRRPAKPLAHGPAAPARIHRTETLVNERALTDGSEHIFVAKVLEWMIHRHCTGGRRSDA